jgi:hypothetical protein
MDQSLVSLQQRVIRLSDQQSAANTQIHDIFKNIRLIQSAGDLNLVSRIMELTGIMTRVLAAQYQQSALVAKTEQGLSQAPLRV